jgi:ribulose-phosphate 3-epimerase
MRPVARKISPSLMCADPLNLKDVVDVFMKYGIEYLHIDIMDGHFVRNFALGMGVCESLATYTDIPLDIHLMIDNPQEFIVDFARFKKCIVTFHPYTVPDPMGVVELIKENGAGAGLALEPAQPVKRYRDLLPHLDLLCVMTVQPGFASQKIVPGGIEKLREVVRYIRSQDYDLEVEVDGNVSWRNLPEMRDAGAQVFVAGTSSVFEKGGDLAKNIRRFRSILEKDLK